LRVVKSTAPSTRSWCGEVHCIDFHKTVTDKPCSKVLDSPFPASSSRRAALVGSCGSIFPFASMVFGFKEGQLVGTNGADGTYLSSNSPGKVAMVNTSKRGTRLSSAATAIFLSRRSFHVIQLISPRATEGHSVHTSTRSAATAIRCHHE